MHESLVEAALDALESKINEQQNEKKTKNSWRKRIVSNFNYLNFITINNILFTYDYNILEIYLLELNL